MSRRKLAPWGFLTPFLVVFAAFWLWPILYSFYLSFLATRRLPWTFDPSQTWGRVAADPTFANALWNTILILVVQVPIMIALATVLAVLLNSTLLRARGIMRFAFFAPVVVGEVAYAAVFRLMFNADLGVVNDILGNLGIEPVQWFSNPNAAMAVIIMAVTWRWAGYNAIIILSGLQSIPQDVYEAATLDRVSPIRQFFFITLPLLRPVIAFCLVLSVIGTMQLFAEPFLITQGGPGGQTETLGLYLYRQGFQFVNFGYASAVAYTITAIAVVMALLNLWIGRVRT